jgi:phage shock protein PspC (stress-responsive transcriptional regulator)
MPPTSTFRRSVSDAKLAGVCSGVAARWGLDPVLVRVGFVLLALTGGVGVILYLAGWLLLPVGTTGRAAVDDLLGGAAARWPRELWITLLVVACIVSFGVFGAISPFGVAPALALLALWWFGFHRPRVRRTRSSSTASSDHADPARSTLLAAPAPQASPVTWAGPPTPFSEAATAWQARVREVRSGVWGPAAPPASTPTPGSGVQDATWPLAPSAAPPPPPPFPPVDPEQAARAAFLSEPDPVGLYTEPAPVPVVRPGSRLSARRLRLVTVTALGLTWLGLGIADALGVAVGLVVYAGSGLLVLALGLVAATRWGRARGLLPAATLVAVAAVLVSSFGSPTQVGAGRGPAAMFERPIAYTSAAAFPVNGDSLDTGDLRVDLSGLTLTSDATYAAVVDTGRVVVRTPPGTGVTLRFGVDTGDVQAYGSHLASGSELTGDRVLVPPAAGQHTLTLDLRVDTGVVEVRS